MEIKLITNMVIDKKTHEITSVNYRKTVSPKSQIVISNTLRADENHIIRLKNKEFGKSKRWNTFSISRDGKVYQHYDPKCQSDFLGIVDVDSKIISIALENMGFLIKTPNDDYVNWLNEKCDVNNVVQKKWLVYDYWEAYTDDQFQALADLCVYLCDAFKIPKKCIEFNHYHKDIHKFRGIVFKSNHLENTNDINPLFDINLFAEKINTEP